ncbi:hypothetical protein MHYP_G00245260 [Metynnis hypsauchen]
MVGIRLQAGRVRDGCLLGDSGYALQTWLMTPLCNPQTDRPEKVCRIVRVLHNAAHRYAVPLLEVVEQPAGPEPGQMNAQPNPGQPSSGHAGEGRVTHNTGSSLVKWMYGVLTPQHLKLHTRCPTQTFCALP